MTVALDTSLGELAGGAPPVSCQVRLVLVPGHGIDSRCRLSLERIEAVLEPLDRDMVEQRRELCPRVLSCDFTHTE